jgi:urease accessory protein
MHKKIGPCLALAALLVAGSAAAHPGHGGVDGWAAGLVHPLSGADHLIAMVVIGIWAAQLGGRALWALPLSFLSMMTLGAALAIACGANLFAASAIESAIATSLLVLGLVVARAARMPVANAMALTASFALFHGIAHGVELPTLADPFRYGLGFVAATAMLHAGGVAIGLVMQRNAPVLARVSGAATAAAGVALLLG